MYAKLPGKYLTFLFKTLPLALVVMGSIFLLASHFFLSGDSMPIEPGLTSDMLKIPLDFINLEIAQYVVETENYLLFQHFESLPPIVFPQLVLAFGVVLWLLIGLAVTLISLFDRMQFIISMGLLIFLLTLTGVNGLNIGGLNTNIPMMILLIGIVLPAVVIHTFYMHWSIGKRTAVILPIALLTFPLLVYLGEATEGELLLSEHLSLLGMAVSALFMLYIGHAFISSVFVLLARLNRGVGIKISWHLSVITVLYLGFFLFLLLKLTGHSSLAVPVPPIVVLFLFLGILGFFETKRKIKQIKQPYHFAAIGEALYLIGFGVAIWVYWKAGFSANQPMLDFMNHVFVYAQLAFSLLFYAYLMSNFVGLMNKGGQVENVLFHPKFFAYYHMRIGAMLAILSIVVFADGIIGVQANVASTNMTADYYYAVNRTREAGILYENSWERYRRNEKAINAVAHLAFAHNQPTSAINTLIRTFENTPTVNDILLLSSSLQKNGSHAEAQTVLERGLALFPENPFLLNNMALLYSKGGRGEEAFKLLDKMDGHEEVVAANKIGLQAKHLVRYDQDYSMGSNVLAQVNQLAFLNLKGDSSTFSLPTNEINDAGSLPSRAILRNQWSNQVTGDVADDIALVDTLVAHNLVPGIEEELRESRVVRHLKQDYINESLKHLNGLAFQFTNSAGFYHSMAANILVGQLDIEKAAIELDQAERRGFANFKPQHLPILYFGGLRERAIEISEKHKADFPAWMAFAASGDLASNDSTVFFGHLSSLHTMVKEQFLTALEEIREPGLKRFFAYQILLRKGHWLEPVEISRLADEIAGDSSTQGGYRDLQELKELLLEENVPQGNFFLDQSLSLERNAYWTPLVFKAMEEAEDNLLKYNVLLEASNFNKDPLLWIYLVKYSRIIGVDSYARATLSKMSAWVDAKTLEELQLQNL